LYGCLCTPSLRDANLLLNKEQGTLQTMAKLKAVIVSDIHYGKDVGGKLGSSGDAQMRKFCRFVDQQKPDLVIDLGDRITCASHVQDSRNLANLARYFNKLAAPRVHLLGNHDIMYMSAADNARLLGSLTNSYSFDLGGIHIIAWNPAMEIIKREIRVPQHERDWLAADLAATELPVLILSHVPLDYHGRPDQDRLNPQGEWYYKRFENCAELRNVLERSGKNFLNLAGDHHRNALSEINDIYYITLHSLTQKQAGGTAPIGAFALLEIDGDSIRLEVKGREPQIYQLQSKILSKAGGENNPGPQKPPAGPRP